MTPGPTSNEGRPGRAAFSAAEGWYLVLSLTPAKLLHVLRGDLALGFRAWPPVLRGDPVWLRARDWLVCACLLIYKSGLTVAEPTWRGSREGLRSLFEPNPENTAQHTARTRHHHQDCL